MSARAITSGISENPDDRPDAAMQVVDRERPNSDHPTRSSGFDGRKNKAVMRKIFFKGGKHR
jgi:hypothetical protein